MWWSAAAAWWWPETSFVPEVAKPVGAEAPALSILLVLQAKSFLCGCRRDVADSVSTFTAVPSFREWLGVRWWELYFIV